MNHLQRPRRRFPFENPVNRCSWICELHGWAKLPCQLLPVWSRHSTMIQLIWQRFYTRCSSWHHQDLNLDFLHGRQKHLRCRGDSFTMNSWPRNVLHAYVEATNWTWKRFCSNLINWWLGGAGTKSWHWCVRLFFSALCCRWTLFVRTFQWSSWILS